MSGALALSMVAGLMVAVPAQASAISSHQGSESQPREPTDQAQQDDFANKTVKVAQANSPRVIAHVKSNDKNIRQGSDQSNLGVYFDKVIDDKFPTPATRRYILTFTPPESGITFRPDSNSTWSCRRHQDASVVCKTDRETEWSKRKAPGEFFVPISVSETSRTGHAKFSAEVKYQQEELDEEGKVVGWREITNPALDQATTAVSITPALRTQLTSLVGGEFVAPAESNSRFGLRLGVQHAEQQGATVRWRQLSGPKLKPAAGSSWHQENITEESIINLAVPKSLKLHQPHMVEFEAIAEDDGVVKRETISVELVRNKPAEAHDTVMNSSDQGTDRTDGKVDREAIKQEAEEQLDEPVARPSSPSPTVSTPTHKPTPATNTPTPATKTPTSTPTPSTSAPTHKPTVSPSSDHTQGSQVDEPTAEASDGAAKESNENAPAASETKIDGVPDTVVAQIEQVQSDHNDLMYDLLKDTVSDELVGALTSGGDEPIADEDMVTESDDVIMRFNPAMAKRATKVTASVKVKETPAGWGGVELARVDWKFTDIDEPTAPVQVFGQQDFSPTWYKTGLKNQVATAQFQSSSKYEGQTGVTATAYLVDPTKRVEGTEPKAIATIVSETFTTDPEPDEAEYTLPESNKEVSVPASQALCKLASDLSQSGAKKELDLRDGSRLTLVHTDASNAKSACDGMWKQLVDKSESTIHSVDAEVTELDGQLKSAKDKLKQRESTGIDRSHLAAEYKAVADLELKRSNAVSEKEAAQKNLSELDARTIESAKAASGSAVASNVKFTKASLSFGGFHFKNVAGEIQVGQGQIMLKELELDARANGSSWVGKLAAYLGKIRGTVTLAYNSKGQPTILKGEAKYGAGKNWINSAGDLVGTLLKSAGLDKSELPILGGEDGQLRDVKGITFSFNTHDDPTVSRKHLAKGDDVPEDGIPGERAILGMAFNITPTPAKGSQTVSPTRGEFELATYYRALDQGPQLVDGRLLINNLGPFDLGESAVLFSGTITMTRAPKTANVQKQIDELKVQEAKKFEEFTVQLRGGAELERLRNKIAQLEASDTETFWGGSLGSTCVSKKIALPAELAGGTDSEGAAYVEQVVKAKTKIAKNPVCPLTDQVGLKGLKLAYVPSHDGQTKAAEGTTIDRTKGWLVQGEFLMWKPDDSATSEDVAKSCSTGSLVKNAPVTAAEAKALGCREIALSLNGQYEPTSNQLDFAIGADGKRRKLEKDDPDEKKNDIADRRAREARETVPQPEAESDSVADIGWGIKLTNIGGELVIDLNKGKPWRDRFAFEVAGKAKGFAGSDDITAAVGIGNICEGKDAEEKRCTKGDIHVTLDVDVPFDPTDAGAKEDSKPSKKAQIVTAQGMLNWTSKRFTIKGSYGNGSADLPAGIKLRDFGLTITNDPNEKPTICVPDNELQAKFDARQVDVDSSLVAVANDKLKDQEIDLKTAQKQLTSDKASLVQAKADLVQAKANKAVASTITSKENDIRILENAITTNENVVSTLQGQIKVQQGNVARSQDLYDKSVKAANAVAAAREEAAKKSQLWIGLAGTAVIGSMQLNLQGRYIRESRDLCMAIQGAKSISYDTKAGAWTSKPDTADDTASNPQTAGNFGVSQWGIVYTSYPTIIQREILNAQTQNTAGPDSTTVPAAVLPPGSPLREKALYQNISVAPGLTVLGRISAGDVVPEQIAGSMKKSQFVDAQVSIGDTVKYGTALSVKVDFNLPQKAYLVGDQSADRERGTLGFVGFGGAVTIGKTGFDLSLNAKADLTSPMLNEENKPDKSVAPSSRNLVTAITGTVTASPAHFGIGLVVGLEESKSAAQVATTAATLGSPNLSPAITQAVVKSGDFGIPGLKIGSGSLSLSVSSASPVPVIVADLSRVQLPASWTEKLALRNSSVSARLVVAPSGGGFGFNTEPLERNPENPAALRELGYQFDLASLGWVESSEIGMSVVSVPYQLPDPKDSTKMIDQPAGVGITFAGRFLGTPLHAKVRVSWGRKIALCTDLILPEMNLAGITFKGYDGRYETPEKRAALVERKAKGTWSCDGKPAPAEPEYDQPAFADSTPNVTQASQALATAAATATTTPPEPTSETKPSPPVAGGNPIMVRLDIDPLAGRYNADIDATVDVGMEGVAYANAGLKGSVRVGNTDKNGAVVGNSLQFSGGGLLQLASANLAEAKFNVDLAQKAGAWHGALSFTAQANIIAVSLGVGGATVVENNNLKALGLRGKAQLLFWDGYVNAMYCQGEIQSVKYGKNDLDAPLPTCEGKNFSFDKSIKVWFGNRQTEYPVSQESPSDRGLIEYKLPIAGGPDILRPDWDPNGPKASLISTLGMFDKYGVSEGSINRMFMTHGSLNKATRGESCSGALWWRECKSYPNLQYRLSITDELDLTKKPAWMQSGDYENMTTLQKSLKAPKWVDGVKNPEALKDRPLAAGNPCVVVARSWVNKDSLQPPNPVQQALAEANQAASANPYVKNGDASNLQVENRDLVIAPRGALRTDSAAVPECRSQIFVSVKDRPIGDNKDNPFGFAYERIRPGVVTCRGKGGQACDVSFYNLDQNRFESVRADSGLWSPDSKLLNELTENKSVTSQ